MTARVFLLLITACLVQVFAGCGSSNAGSDGGTDKPAGGSGGGSGNPSPGTINSVNHILLITQENRSFDHYFSQLPEYWQAHNYPQATNGTTLDVASLNFSNPDPSGATVGTFNLQSACNENPSPSWNESHVDRNHEHPTDSNNAANDTPMDGFAPAAGGDARGFGFL